MTTTTAPPEQATNSELIRWSFDMLNQGEVSPLKQFWTEDTVERFPDRTCHGGDEIAAYFEDTLAAVSDWHLEIVSIAEEGDDVFVQWHLTGKHTGPLLGIEPTGKDLSVDGIDHFVIRDGRVVSNFVVVDRVQYGQQIGMLPPDGSTADKVMKAAFNARTKLTRRLKR